MILPRSVALYGQRSIVGDKPQRYNLLRVIIHESVKNSTLDKFLLCLWQNKIGVLH